MSELKLSAERESGELIPDAVIEAYQRRKAAELQQAMQQCMNDLIALADSRGLRIIGIPRIVNGLITDDWGVTQK